MHSMRGQPRAHPSVPPKRVARTVEEAAEWGKQQRSWGRRRSQQERGRLVGTELAQPSCRERRRVKAVGGSLPGHVYPRWRESLQ